MKGSQDNPNGYVTFKWLAGVIASTVLGMSTLFLSFGSWAWSVHANQPHKGAIEREEYNRDQAQIERELDRLFAEVKSMNSKVDKILERSLNN